MRADDRGDERSIRVASQLHDPLQLVGTVVDDKYLIEALVAEGGFSLVYRARHRIWDQPVALKVFAGVARVPHEARRALVDAFIREGELMARMSSRIPEIAQARDTGTLSRTDGVQIPYLVLEWLDGATLDDLLVAARVHAHPGWSIEAVVELLDGPCRALARIHDEGIAHRDLKPANLFVVGGALTPGAVVKLLDFGVAKVMGESGAMLARTSVQGTSFTPAYGAPEQFDRRLGATGPWTDVFAMALVMVEMLCGGRPALSGRTLEELAIASQDHDCRPTPRTQGIEVSDAVEAVFARSLAVSPSARYGGIGDLWCDLAGAVAGDAEAGEAVARPSATIVALPPPAPALPVDRAKDDAARRSEPPSSTPAIPPRRSRWLSPALGMLGLGAILTVVIAQRRSPPIEIAAADVEAPAVDRRAEIVAPPDVPRPCPPGMTKVDGGKFFMGTDADHPALQAAQPAHQVSVGPFCIDTDEITVDAYRTCSTTGECERAHRTSWWPRGASAERAWTRERAAYDPLCNEAHDGRGTHPVNCVTWAQAAEYCTWARKRLPTEAEWEFAARGSDGRVFPWGDAPPDRARANACGTECGAWRAMSGLSPQTTMHNENDGFVGTAPVGSFAAGQTRWGQRDMVGNVFEWVADTFQPYVGGQDRAAAPSAARVIRGGAFNSYVVEFADPALRFGADPETRTPAIGFRCASDLLAAE